MKCFVENREASCSKIVLLEFSIGRRRAGELRFVALIISAMRQVTVCAKKRHSSLGRASELSWPASFDHSADFRRSWGPNLHSTQIAGKREGLLCILNAIISVGQNPN
jgi:hypothetical protein